MGAPNQRSMPLKLKLGILREILTLGQLFSPTLHSPSLRVVAFSFTERHCLLLHSVSLPSPISRCGIRSA